MARLFTLKQLKEFILNRLEDCILRKGCRVLLVNCINQFDGVRREEARVIRGMVLEKIRELTLEYDLTTIVSLSWR